MSYFNDISICVMRMREQERKERENELLIEQNNLLREQNMLLAMNVKSYIINIYGKEDMREVFDADFVETLRKTLPSKRR